MTVNNVEFDIFGQVPVTRSGLSVAQENFTASRPPIRNLNATEEILQLLRNHPAKQAISRMFEEAPEKALVSRTSRLLTHLRL